MSSFFYFHLTEKVAKPAILLFLNLIGIKKGDRLIWVNSSHNNSGDGTEVMYCKIMSFDIGWVTNKKMYFVVNLALSYDTKKPYSKAFVPLNEFLSLYFAQVWLKKWYSKLPDNLKEPESYVHTATKHNKSNILNVKTFS